jgi:NRPS condensation-like uncharacterized protein
MAQQNEFIESINIDSLKIIKLSALYTALGATINSNIIYLVKLRLSTWISACAEMMKYSMSLLNLQGFVNRDKHESMNICGGNHIVLRNISF